MRRRWENPFDCAPNDDIAVKIMYTVEWVYPTCEKKCEEKYPLPIPDPLKILQEIPEECKNLEYDAFRECMKKHILDCHRQLNEYIERRKKDPAIRKREKEFERCMEQCVENYKLQIAKKYGVDPECVEALWAEY
jgi:hypothetical protein